MCNKYMASCPAASLPSVQAQPLAITVQREPAWCTSGCVACNDCSWSLTKVSMYCAAGCPQPEPA